MRGDVCVCVCVGEGGREGDLMPCTRELSTRINNCTSPHGLHPYNERIRTNDCPVNFQVEFYVTCLHVRKQRTNCIRTCAWTTFMHIYSVVIAKLSTVEPFKKPATCRS